MTGTTKKIARFATGAFGAIAVGLALAGCGTSTAVTELTTLTGNHAGTLALELQKLEESSQRVAETRAANLAILGQSEARLRVLTTTKIGAFHVANPDKRELYDRIFESVAAVAEARKAAGVSHRDRVKSRLAKRTALKVPASELNGVAKDLASLASEPSLQQQFDFLREFLGPSLELLRGAVKNGNAALAKPEASEGIASLLDESP